MHFDAMDALKLMFLLQFYSLFCSSFGAFKSHHKSHLETQESALTVYDLSSGTSAHVTVSVDSMGLGEGGKNTISHTSTWNQINRSPHLLTGTVRTCFATWIKSYHVPSPSRTKIWNWTANDRAWRKKGYDFTPDRCASKWMQKKTIIGSSARAPQCKGRKLRAKNNSFGNIAWAET